MTLEITRLKNGLTVITDCMPHLMSAAVGVWVATGSRSEVPEWNGISHMLEHMAFKGTTRRTTWQIAEEVEAVGGHINAYTSREFTGYYLRVLKDDVPMAVDILADILQHSTFEREELERERGVILQEIGEAEDTPDDIIFDHLQETAYPGHALGRPILGTTDTVNSFQADDLRRYMAAFYHPGDMVLVASGAVEHEAVVTLAEALFQELPAVERSPLAKAPYGGGNVVTSRRLEQLHVALAFDGLAYDDDDYYAVQVLANLFGGGMTSRLFQEVREKRGLAYTVYSFANSYRDGGMFGLYAGTGPREATELLHVIGGELDRLADGVGEDELERSRAQLRSSIVMALESPSARAEQAARQQLVFGRLFGPEEMMAAIDAVDGAAIARVAERVTASAPTLALLGPAKGVTIPPRLRAA